MLTRTAAALVAACALISGAAHAANKPYILDYYFLSMDECLRDFQYGTVAGRTALCEVLRDETARESEDVARMAHGDLSARPR
jgi:hypothetical protein